MQFNILVPSTSAVVPETEYSWNTYTSAASFGVLFRGKEVILAKDTQFGLRDGTKGTARLILRGEPTKVITVSPEERTVLLARATPVTSKRGKPAKVAGVVPTFDAAAAWKNDLAKLFGPQFQQIGKLTGPSIELHAQLNALTKAVRTFEEGKATASDVKDLKDLLTTRLAKAPALPKDTYGNLARTLIETSPELKKIRAGSPKVATLASAGKLAETLFYASKHVGLARVIAAGKEAAILKAVRDLDTSVRESLPKQVDDPLRLMQAQARVRAK